MSLSPHIFAFLDSTLNIHFLAMKKKYHFMYKSISRLLSNKAFKASKNGIAKQIYAYKRSGYKERVQPCQKPLSKLGFAIISLMKSLRELFCASML